MDNIFVRTMTKEDIDQVVKIEEESFALPWSVKSFEESLELKYAKFFVAFMDDVVAGYVGTYHIGDEIDITNIAVASAFRRKGVASELMKAVVAYGQNLMVECINLEVRISNVSARGLYAKYDFEELGVRKNFYSKPTEDGLIMRKNLTNQ